MKNGIREYERTLRHVMCIFLSLEALIFCCFITGIISGGHSMILLKYHESALAEVITLPLILCPVPIVLTFFSIFCRAVYCVYEGLHTAFGVCCLLILMSGETFLLGVFLFLFFSSRLIIYLILLSRKKEKMKRKI